jgi:hypothetical protein
MKDSGKAASGASFRASRIVVEDGRVSFNTGSYTLVAVDEQAGKMSWRE